MTADKPSNPLATTAPDTLSATLPSIPATCAYASTEAIGPNLARGAGPDIDSLQPRLKRGTRIAQYELIRELGRGGMGQVFLARDTRLGRLVAIKFLADLDGDRPARFLGEARATARCKHENIVVIHDVDAHDGQPYLVLEYLEGASLRALLDKRWRPSGEAGADITATGKHAGISRVRALELMIPVVRALAHAHAQGLVHRDLKPENIMLTDAGTIKVLDFGIATAFAAKSRRATSHVDGERALIPEDRTFETEVGAIMGTLPYMSPEQWGVGDIDQRSDIWAVGIMLYEMVTGQHPLAPLSRKRLLQVPELDTPMLSEPSVADVDGTASARGPELGVLGPIIAGCLRKHKGERIPSADMLLAEMESLLPGRLDKRAARTGEQQPFAGLAAFQESDAERFFGRERDTASMLSRLRNQPLLALVGPSGAGKSSFVRAGVIPALARSGSRWESFVIRPGRHPLSALASVLDDIISPSERETLLDTLRTQPGYLGTRLRARARARKSRYLMFVDQFEELYTQGASADERLAFAACLEAVADDASSPLRVILSMRSDFLDRVTEDRALSHTVSRGLVLLSPMNRDGLRQALTRPVEDAGVQFETPDMIESMLSALEHTRSPLPLLQFTAAALWEQRDRERGLLTVDSHDRIGGVEGALSTHADGVIAVLSPAERRLAQSVFVQLVTGERTRALANMNELCDRARADRGKLEQVIDHLAGARLISIETHDKRDGATVELVHESLIVRWPTLGRWLDENAEERAFLERVATASRQWHAGGRVAGLLWREQAAHEAEAWLDKRISDSNASDIVTGMSERDEDYLDAVVAFAERARRRRRFTIGGVIASLLVLAVILASVAMWATGEKTRAERAALEAETEASRARMAEAEVRAQRAELQREVERSRDERLHASARKHELDATTVFALLREVRQSPPPKDWSALVHAALYAGIAKTSLDHPAGVRAAQFSPDGRRIATASADKRVRIWNADGVGAPLELIGHDDIVNSVMFRADGRQLVTASEDNTARIWNIERAGTTIVLRGHDDRVSSAVFSQDGRFVVTASYDGSVRRWRTDGSGDTTIVGQHPDRVHHADISPDGTRIVTACEDGFARVWHVENAEQATQVLPHGGSVLWARFNPDGTRIATGSADGYARVWRADGTRTPRILGGSAHNVSSVAFHPDGIRLVVASYFTIRVWNPDTDHIELSHSQDIGDVRTAVFSADGSHIATAGATSARVWTFDATRTARELKCHEGWVRSAAFAPEGTRVVTLSYDDTACVWNLEHPGPPTRLQSSGTTLTAVAFRADGERVATGSNTGTVHIWNPDAPTRPVMTMQGHQSAIASIAFSPDGHRVVTTSRERTARVWHVPSGQLVKELNAHSARVNQAAYRPDGAILVTVSHDDTAILWSTDDHRRLRTLDAHEHDVDTVAFHPDGTRFITASKDNTARVWSMDQLQSPRVLSHAHSVKDARFLADGRIVTLTENKAFVWPVDGVEQPQALYSSFGFVAIGTNERAPRLLLREAHGVQVVTDLSPLEVGDRRLWRATDYCMSVTRRKQLLGVSEDRARANFDRCQQEITR